jgi:hypothetical protein
MVPSPRKVKRNARENNNNSITEKSTKSNYSCGHFELTRNPLGMSWSSESMEP